MTLHHTNNHTGSNHTGSNHNSNTNHSGGNRHNGDNGDNSGKRQPVVYLARHGTPDWSMTSIRYDIPPGPPLVEQGEAEAARLGEFLQAQGVQKIYASPLVRSLRTAQIAAAVSGIAVEIAEEVAEYRREENDATVWARLQPFFLRIWDEAAVEGPIAIVSHGGPVRVLLEKLGVLPDILWHYRRQFDHQNPLPPAAAWRVSAGAQPGERQLELAFASQSYIPYQPLTVTV